MQDLLSDLKKGRYEFKEPWRATDRSMTIVVPIVCNEHGKRNYFVLEEVKDRVRIVDTGGINALRIEGDVSEATFVRGGTMLKGFTQERATQFGFITIPSRSGTIPVHCIHASRGIRAGVELRVAESAPMRVYSSILHDRSQRKTWLEVEKYNEEVRRFSQRWASGRGLSDVRISEAPRDDLMQTVEAIRNFDKDLQEMLKRIPDYVGQVGTVIIDPDGVVGLEIYDHPDSWKAFSETIVRSFGESLTREDKTGLFKLDVSLVNSVIQDFIDLVAHFTPETVFTGKKTETVVVRGTGYVGEYTCLEGKAIHMLITRTASARYNENQLQRPAELTADFPRIRGERRRRESAVQRFLNWGKRKTSKGKEVMAALNREPKTWTDLEDRLDMSKATLSSRLKELQERGVVEKSEGSNGASRYGLTAIGQDLLHENGALHSRHSFVKKYAALRKDVRVQQEKLNEECPACHSRNSAIWSFDEQNEQWECLKCKHKWKRARKL